MKVYVVIHTNIDNDPPELDGVYMSQDAAITRTTERYSHWLRDGETWDRQERDGVIRLHLGWEFFWIHEAVVPQEHPLPRIEADPAVIEHGTPTLPLAGGEEVTDYETRMKQIRQEAQIKSGHVGASQ